MLLLYHTCPSERLLRPSFTFHYASTLSPTEEDLQDLILNLHSTMLLLYRSGSPDGRSCISLFTFHYASTLSVKRDGFPDMYHLFTFHYASTLSRVPDPLPRIWIRFTFHYASTLSRECLRITNSMTAFTFHYASTLSEAINKSEIYRPNLHSTMLLLYRSSGIFTTAPMYLHSTMLLLYPPRKRRKNP